MSIVKSLSVDRGDMFYIYHDANSFTVIDCCLVPRRRKEILNEIREKRAAKRIYRFISTHPDKDHIYGLTDLNQRCPIDNFYVVKNNVSKHNKNEDFEEYKKFRDCPKAFHLARRCKRRWLNESNEEVQSANIEILWPDTKDEHFKNGLQDAKRTDNPNNISPIIRYQKEDGSSFMWMGDLETEFMEKILDKVELTRVDVLFAPHHGRDSGKVPRKWLKTLNPKIIVIGQARSEYLNYYPGWNTITQNSAGDITFECRQRWTHVYVSKPNYSEYFLRNLDKENNFGGYYIGSF
ncbi:MAG: hypothetical protein OXO49_02005 [Gammaproteobacteria bacterium]|nr:hypothetical protein [Gammaproteobacteria bacterium]MDE0251278.1 hypothetical protein [Gammaproteobacteria bacterium]MDE0402037.1 hypothetical protein [Gammaproteobacteria bacterium]